LFNSVLSVYLNNNPQSPFLLHQSIRLPLHAPRCTWAGHRKRRGSGKSQREPNNKAVRRTGLLFCFPLLTRPDMTMCRSLLCSVAQLLLRSVARSRPLVPENGCIID